MTLVREFRSQPPPLPQPRRREWRGLIATVAAALGAFAIGGLAVFGWNDLPAPGQWTSPLKLFVSANTINFPGERMGRAATAPFLKISISNELFGIRHQADLAPGTLLQYLEAGDTGQTVSKFGTPPEHAVLDHAAKWGEVADCIYKQNSWHLCDIDNRALAVKAGNAFLGQADRIISAPQAKFAAEPGEVRAISMVKDRVLDALRERLRSGVLIARDFEGGVPVAVARELVEIKPVQNECAKQ
jgi:hypothetical protein